MNSLPAQWTAVGTGAGAGGAPLRDPTLPMCNSVRIRREYHARDAINSRSWDNFHATPATQVSSADLRAKQGPVFMDMNPIATRTNTVQYRIQPQYIPDPPRGSTANDGSAPPPGATAVPPDTFSTNPYTQRLDAGGSDARNMIRELRSAVVEDNRERHIDADRVLVQRQFYDRWLPEKAATDAASLQAYELLRPKQDDWRSS